jgi:hypothetical protein
LLPPAAASTPLGAAGLLSTVDAAPTESFFHACVPAFSDKNHRLYRIYVTTGDLLVFAIGIGAVSMGAVLPRTRSLLQPQPGLVHAIAAMHEAAQLQLARRIAELDVADEATLRGLAASGDDAFRVEREDVKWMTLGGPSLWYRWICSVQHEAVWKFAHRTLGRHVFALPSLRDARRAAEWLPRLFGERVQVTLRWGSSGRRS